jgi:coproporphyrinogen III oxidase-like Fe-S oxidoreductase
MGIFETLNADMMFNFPMQDRVMLDRDLDILLDTGIDQVTYYPLMVSDPTRQLVSAAIGRVDYRNEESLYRQIVKKLLSAYGLSTAWCFSKRGLDATIDEYIVQSDEYAGLGSGAIGFLDGTCYANTFDIEGYIAMLGAGRPALFAARRFRPDEQIRYHFLMKLFATRLDLAGMRTTYGSAFDRYIFPAVFALNSLGAVRRDGSCLRLTDRGLYLWVVMMREFFSAVNNFRDLCRQGVVS